MLEKKALLQIILQMIFVGNFSAPDKDHRHVQRELSTKGLLYKRKYL